jgi:hypothetical protein
MDSRSRIPVFAGTIRDKLHDNDILLVIADYGGTWLRVTAFNQSGEIVRFFKAASIPLSQLPSLLKNLLRRWTQIPRLDCGIRRKIQAFSFPKRFDRTRKYALPFLVRKKSRLLRLGSSNPSRGLGWTIEANQGRPMNRGATTLIVGAKGIWTHPNQRKFLERNLKGCADRVEVLSDVELAYQLTFGDRPGIVLVAGTGSIAYGEDECGHHGRAGGHGPLKGDQGSAYWIGKEWIRLKKLRIKTKSVSEIASLAPEVILKAQRKDSDASKVVRNAINHLSDLVLEVKRQLSFKKPVRIAFWGGMFDNKFFKAQFKRQAGRFLWLHS